MIIWGINRLYGRTDRIPGLLFVATTFFHLFFIPLIPVGSYIVMEKDDEWESFKGIHIGLSFKSWLYAWGRAAAVLGIPLILYQFYVAYMFVDYSGDFPRWAGSPGWMGILLLALAIGGWWFMRVTSKASDARAAELLQMVGLKFVPAGGEAVKT